MDLKRESLADYEEVPVLPHFLDKLSEIFTEYLLYRVSYETDKNAEKQFAKGFEKIWREIRDIHPEYDGMRLFFDREKNLIVKCPGCNVFP